MAGVTRLCVALVIALALAPLASASAEPPQPVIESPENGSVSNQTMPSFSGSSNDSFDEITLTIYEGEGVGGSTVGSPLQTFPNLGGSWSVGPAGPLSDGVYTAQASQTSLLEGPGSSQVTFTVDTTPPAVSITSPTNGSFVKGSPTPTFSGHAGNASGDSGTVTLTLTRSGSSPTKISVGRSGNTWSYKPSSLPEGSYTLTVEQEDAAHNVGSASVSFTAQTQPPSVSIISPTNGSSVKSTPTFSGTAASASGDSSTVTLTLEQSGGGRTTIPVARSGGTWSYTPSSLPDGSYTLTAEQEDEAGNVGSASVSFTVDTTPPAVSITSPTNGSFVKGSPLPTFKGAAGNASGDSSSVTLTLALSGGGTTKATVNRTGSSWSYTPSSLPEGSYTLTVEQSDAAGNVGSASVSFTVQTQAPTVSIISPTSGSSIKGSPPPTFSGTASAASGDSADVTLKITPSGGGTSEFTVARSGGTWSYTPSSLPDGSYTLTAEQEDEAGNTGSATVTFTVDSTPPAVSITSPTNGSFVKGPTPTFKGAAGNASGDSNTVTLTLTPSGGSPTKIPVTRSGATWSYTPTSIAEGSYTLTAEQEDKAGNVGSASVSFTVQTQAPGVTITAPTNGATIKGSPVPTFGGAAGNVAGDSTTVTVTLTPSGGSPTKVSVARTGAAWSYTPTSLPDGKYTLTAEQEDSAGNVGSASVSFSADSTPPVVSITSPTNGSYIKGSPVPTFTGAAGTATGDQTTVSVTLTQTGGSTSSETVTVSAGKWSYKPAALPEGEYTLTVEQADTAGNKGTASSAFTVRTQAPAVTIASPANGSFVKSSSPPAFSGAAGNLTGDSTTVKLTLTPGVGTATKANVTRSGATWTYTPSSLPEGSYTLKVEQEDEAHIVGSASATFTALTAPSVTITSPGGKAPGNEKVTPTPNFEGTAGTKEVDHASVKVTVYTAFSGSEPTSAALREIEAEVKGGKWSTKPLPEGLPNGEYTARAEQTDEAGDVGFANYSFKINSGGPAPTLTPIARETNDATPTFGGAVPVAGEVRLKICPGTIPSCSSPREPPVTISGATWSAGPIEALPDGTYTALAEETETKAPKDTGVSREPTTFTVDTVAPVVSVSSPGNGSSATGSSQVVEGVAGALAGDLSTVTVELASGSSIDPPAPAQTRTVQREGGRWRVDFEGLAPGTYTVKAEQSDEAGNAGASSPVTFTLNAPSSDSSSSSPPTAAFTWVPSSPHVGEVVSLLSSSSDSSSSIEAFAWDLGDTGTFVPGAATNSTRFTTAGNHVVRLQVRAADGQSSVASETIGVLPSALSLMRPFPIVRITSTDTRSGIRLRVLKVQAPGGARISVTCRNRGCPAKTQKMVAAAAAGGVASYTFHKFQRALRAGVIIEVRISSPTQIGKYTRLTVRRGKLPQRVDLCLSPGGTKAITCPS